MKELGLVDVWCSHHPREREFTFTSAVPVGSMYSYRKVGGQVAFSWMAKLFNLPCLVSLFSAQPHMCDCTVIFSF